MSLKDYIEDFLLSKEIEDGCSPATIKAYRYDLNLFMKSLPPNIAPERISAVHIRAFLKKLKDKGYTKIAIARKIACLRSFFNFLEINEYITKNPIKKIHSPRIKREEYLPKFLTLDEIRYLLNFLKDGSKLPYRLRKRGYLIVRLLYATMARVSEIANAKVGDLDPVNRTLRLRGKGNKERIVLIDRETAELLKRHLEERLAVKPEDPLIVNHLGRPLGVRTIQRDINLIKKLAGFDEHRKLTPHIFRHTGATHLRQAGMDISELQDLLGHSSPNTTRIYAKNDLTRLKKEYEMKHPLSSVMDKERDTSQPPF